MDLTASRYASFQDLSLYCYRVASVVGLICLHIFGPTSARAQDYAVDLGMAFQLTNILRDIGTDAAQGRIYLPQEDLRSSAAPIRQSSSDKKAQNSANCFTSKPQGPMSTTQKHRRRSRPYRHSDRRALTVSEIMRAVYFRILKKIEEPGHQIFGPRARLSTSRRLAVAAGVWLRSRFS